MYKQYLIKFTFLIALLISSHTAWAAVKAFLNQTTFYEGDPITLTIETDNKTNAQPDFTPLQRNFDLLGTSTSSQINIINGRSSFKKSWIIELQPKIKGKLEIPAITIGNESTAPITLTIADLPPEIKAETSKHVMVESSIGTNDNETYVQQQIPYTVKLLYDASMVSGEISPLNVENAVIEQLGDEKRYQIVKAGKRFNVIEKNFVISPEKSGKLHIPPTVVTGRLALNNGQQKQPSRRRMDPTDFMNSFFDDFRNDPFFNDSFGGSFFSNRRIGQSKPFTATSQAIDVNVLPVPKAFTGKAWLPAEAINIKDSWRQNPPELKVGEPVTRTLVLQAKGLAGSQIPEINIPKPDGMKVYPETAKTETRTDGKTVYGIQELKITYIPNKKGKVSIPPINIDWWNVKSKQQQTYTVPAWNLNVAPGSAIDNNTPVDDVDLDSGTQNTGSTEETPQSELKEPTNQSPNGLIIGSMISGLGLLIALLAYWWFKRKASSVTATNAKKTVIKVDPNEIKTALLRACDNNDKHAAAKYLLQWAQLTWPDATINNLGALAARVANGKEAILALERSLYASDAQQWDGQALKEQIMQGMQLAKDQAPAQQEGLAPLYPV